MLGQNTLYLYFQQKDLDEHVSSLSLKIDFAKKRDICKALIKTSNLNYLDSSKENSKFSFNLYFNYIGKQKKNAHCCIIPTYYNKREKSAKHMKSLLPHIAEHIFNDKTYKKFYKNVKSFKYTLIEADTSLYQLDPDRGFYFNPNKYKQIWLMNGTLYKKD